MRQDYTALIEAELRRLDGLKTQKGRRDKTILALAQAIVDGESTTEVLRGKGTVCLRSYYDKHKDWHHNLLFQEVLGKVTELYRQRDNEIREAAEERGRRQRHEARVKLIETAKDKATALLEKMTVDDQRADHVIRFIVGVFGEERKEFEELQPKRVDVTSGGKPLEPAGGNVAIATAAGTVGGVNIDDLPDDDLDKLIKNLQIAVSAHARQTT